MKASHLMRSAAIAALGVSAFLLPDAVHAVGVAGQGTWETTLKPRDLDHNGQTDAFYDTVLNVTWLRNTNVAGSAGTWDATNAWANALVVGNRADWRLPTMVDTGAPGCDLSGGAGGTDCGYNMPSAASKSEFAHLFFVTLGNKSFCDPNGSTVSLCIPQAGFGPTNTGDFQGIDAQHHLWLALEYGPDKNYAWYFNLSGAQGQDQKLRNWRAVAVHAGDIGMVPEPSTYALILLGLASLLAVGKRRRR